jgi:hypothetical protein
MIRVIMFWIFACSVGTPGLDLPLVLRGDDVVVEVTNGDGCKRSDVRVGLWGQRFGTLGHTLADVVEDEDGSTWLHFRVQTGLGEAIAALRVQGNGAVLPLGVRPGENEIHLSVVEAHPEEWSTLAARTAETVEAEQRLWENGAFVIRSDGEPVGEIQFRGDRSPIVNVADAWWLTPRPVEAELSSEGAELIVTFDVEPSFQGEGAQLRINVPTRTAVAPLGPVPVPEERQFTLVPGQLSGQDRAQMQRDAIERADRLEQQYVEELARRLSAAAVLPEGKCTPWEVIEAEWGVMFPGYAVDVLESESGSGCSVGIEPIRVQHGRRYRGVVIP